MDLAIEGKLEDLTHKENSIYCEEKSIYREENSIDSYENRGKISSCL